MNCLKLLMIIINIEDKDAFKSRQKIGIMYVHLGSGKVKPVRIITNDVIIVKQIFCKNID